MTGKPKILIVDDRPENLVALERTLSDLEVDFVRAASGNDALKETLLHDFAIALIDVQMAGMDGFETVTLMREENRTAHLPVIFLSAIYKEDYYQIKGIKAGAVDFITKPIVPEILIGKVQVFLDLYKKEQALRSEINRRLAYEEALTAAEARQIELNGRLRGKLDELSLSEERFKSLVMTIPDIVYRIDRDGCFTYINQAIERLGYTVENLLGKHFSTIIVPADIEHISRRVVLPKYRHAQTGDEKAPRLFDERRTGDRRTMGLEVRLLGKAGGFQEGVVQDLDLQTIAVEINSTGIYGSREENGRRKMFIGTVGVIRDISERKKREARIRRQQLLFEGISRILLEALTCDTPEAVTAVALKTAAEITTSPFGFIGVFDDAQTAAATTVGNAQWQPYGLMPSQVAQLLDDREIAKCLESIYTSGRVNPLTGCRAAGPVALTIRG